jgi:hypothetical protein
MEQQTQNIISCVPPPHFIQQNAIFMDHNQLNENINQFRIIKKYNEIKELLNDIEELRKSTTITKKTKQLDKITVEIIYTISSIPIPLFQPHPLVSHKQKKAMRYSKFYGVGKGNYIRSKKKISYKKRKLDINKINKMHYKNYINLSKEQFEFLLIKVNFVVLKKKMKRKLGRKNSLFACLMYLKGNVSRFIICEFFGISYSTISRLIEENVLLIITALNNIININNLSTEAPHPILKVCGSIDHTHCRTSRSNLLQRENYRADKGHAYISTVITNREGIICHFETGFRGATNDNRVVAMSRERFPNKLCGDAGFRNTHLNILTPKDLPNPVLRALLNYERVVVEITNACIKRYGVLKNNWLNQKPYLHSFVALACAQLTNLQLMESPIRDKLNIKACDNIISNKITK